MLQISKYLYFDSAHRNEHKGGKYAQLHGHTFYAEIIAEGSLHPDYGWIVDFSEIKKSIVPIIDMLDHSYLNEITGLEKDATIPAIEKWFWEEIPEKPWWFKGVRIGIIGDLDFKPCKLPAEKDLPELWCFSFESAQSLPQLPNSHPCHNLHGHSYFVKVGSKDMDNLPSVLRKIYDLLDHRWLNEIPGLEKATSEILTYWIIEKLYEFNHPPDVVIVQETPSSYCLWRNNNID